MRANKTTNRHLDFALLNPEVTMCAICKRGVHWRDDWVETVTIGGVTGLIAFCENCLGDYYCMDDDERRNKREQLIAQWRPTAPPCIPVVSGEPIQLIVRGKCDDHKLVEVITTTFNKIPVRSRTSILAYLHSDRRFDTGTGLRFEVLGRWSGLGDKIGMNLDGGHAIRLRASYVNGCVRYNDMEDLMVTIAQELAHTEQEAEAAVFETDDECERDVEERLKGWGFESGPSTNDRDRMLAYMELVIQEAEAAKKVLVDSSPPSTNFVCEAFSQAERAANHICRATDRWRGR